MLGDASLLPPAFTSRVCHPAVCPEHQLPTPPFRDHKSERAAYHLPGIRRFWTQIVRAET
jgi:hypothetical protein